MAQGHELTLGFAEESGTKDLTNSNYTATWGVQAMTNMRGLLLEAPDSLNTDYEQTNLEEFSRGHREVETWRMLTRSVSGDVPFAAIRFSDPLWPMFVKHLFGKYDMYGTLARGGVEYGLAAVGDPTTATNWGKTYLHAFVLSEFRYEGTRQGELGNYWFGSVTDPRGANIARGTLGRTEGITGARLLQSSPGGGVKSYPFVGLRPVSASPLIGITAGEPVVSSFTFVGKQQLGTLGDISAQITLPGQNDQVALWSDATVVIDYGTREIDSCSVTVEDPLEVQPTIRASNDKTIGQALPAGFTNVGFEFAAQWDTWQDTLRAKAQGGDGTAVDVKVQIKRGTSEIYVHLPRWKPEPQTPQVGGPGRHVQSWSGRCFRTTVANIGTYSIRVDWVGTAAFVWNTHTFGTTEYKGP